MVWKTGDWLSVPATAKADLGSVKIVHKTDTKVTVGGTELVVAYREARPEHPKLDVLLLHGASFKSQTWVEKPLFTLQILGNLGYRAVAIDLPGFGDSPSPAGKVDPALYMEAVIVKLNLVAPVIVSPSMSGRFSLPYIFKDPGKVASRCRGFVPVAPVQTEHYTIKQYTALTVPSLVVCGENDHTLGPKSLENLRKLPNSVVDIFNDCGHACYLGDPDAFHSHLYTFLSSL